MKKLLITSLLLLFIAGCSEKPLARIQSEIIEIDMGSEFDPRSVFLDIQDGVEILYEINEEESTCRFVLTKGERQEVFDNVKVTLIYPEIVVPTVPFKATVLEDLEIYDEHSCDSNLAGYTRKGDSFEVYEVFINEDNIWCRISSKHWINNEKAEKLEIIPYNTDITYIKNVITFTDESAGGRERKGIMYDWYSGDAGLETHREWGDVTQIYDDYGRVIEEIIDEKSWWDKYTLDSNGNIIHVIDFFGGVETCYDFTYDEQNRIITEKSDYIYSKSFYIHEYDQNGNLGRIAYDNIAIVEFEINGNLRFETTSRDSVIHNYRFSKNGEMIELFKAPDGDIGKPMPMYK